MILKLCFRFITLTYYLLKQVIQKFNTKKVTERVIQIIQFLPFQNGIKFRIQIHFATFNFTSHCIKIKIPFVGIKFKIKTHCNQN